MDIFICNKCNKRFNRKYHLQRHMKNKKSCFSDDVSNSEQSNQNILNKNHLFLYDFNGYIIKN